MAARKIVAGLGGVFVGILLLRYHLIGIAAGQ